MRKTSGKASLIAFFSVAVPFLLGTFALAPSLYETHSTINGLLVPKLSFTLFVGTSMSVTAFPVLARIITEKGLQKLELGSMTLACAALNDVVAWALLAVVLAVQKSQQGAVTGSNSIAYAPVLIELAEIVAVVIGSFLFVQPLMRITVFNHYKRTGSLSSNRLAWVMIGMFLTAWLVHHIGFHAMLGSFTFGLVFPRGVDTPFLYSILSKVEPFATLVLLPLFFMVTGLSIDLSALSNPKLGRELLYILLVASFGKFIGAGVVARALRMSNRHSAAVGVMMNTRGLTEIVVLNIAKQANIIDDEVFTMLVLMAVLTTAIAGPLLTLIFPQHILVEEKAKEHAQVRSIAGGSKRSKGVAQLVVIVHDCAHAAKLLTAAVATLAPNMRAHLDVAQFFPPGELHSATELGTGMLESPEELQARIVLNEQCSAVARRGLSSSVTVTTTQDVVAEALWHIRSRNPQIVVTDWPALDEERARLKEMVVQSPCTVVLWGGYSPVMVTGGDPSAGLSCDAINTKPHALKGEQSPVSATVDAAKPEGPVKPMGRSLLMKLLRDEKAQDDFSDALMASVFARMAAVSEAVQRHLPPSLRHADLKDDDDDEHEHGGMSSSRVNPDSSVVTPRSMAVAAAASLSPKFSQLLITGWPESEAKCAELMHFLHEVAHEVEAARASMETRRTSVETRRASAKSPTASFADRTDGVSPFVMSSISEDATDPDMRVVAELRSSTVLLRPGLGTSISRETSVENLDSVTTAEPMLGITLSNALNAQLVAEKVC